MLPLLILLPTYLLEAGQGSLVKPNQTKHLGACKWVLTCSCFKSSQPDGYVLNISKEISQVLLETCLNISNPHWKSSENLMPGATQQFTIQTGTFLRVLIMITGTKWGNSGQTAGTYCHPTNGKPSCYECCPCNSPWYLGEQLALNGLCNNLILLSFYLFVNLWNGNKRSRRLKLEGKFEEFFSLPSSYLMLIILWENLTLYQALLWVLYMYDFI